MSVESPAEPEKQSVLQGFKEFLMRGNVVELAVAVVVGTAFSKIVDAIVSGLINPLVGAIGSQDLEKYSYCLQDPCKTGANGEMEGIPINWGPILSATLTFVMTAAVVYFLMILPMNKYKERQAAKLPPVEVPPTEVELLTQIRDAMIPQRDGTADDALMEGAVPGEGASVAQQRSAAGSDSTISTEK